MALIVALPQGTYSIRFNHSKKITEENVPYDKICECNIKNLTDDSIVATAQTFKSKKDNNNKERARKLSLSRALQESDFTKTERAKFWEVYRNRKPANVSA